MLLKTVHLLQIILVLYSSLVESLRSSKHIMCTNTLYLFAYSSIIIGLSILVTDTAAWP